MKKLLLIMLLLLPVLGCWADDVNEEEQENVPLSTECIDDTHLGGNPIKRIPPMPPKVVKCGHTLYIIGIGADYVLQLRKNGMLIYSIPVVAGTNTLQLPSIGSTCKLELLVGSFCFWGMITI